MCDCNNPNPFVNPCEHLAAEIAATPLTTATPADVRAAHAKSVLSDRIRAQAERMRAKNARYVNARANGYKGPMTRTELARLAEQKAARNG